jgi:3-phosphoglycerate kinase
MAIGGGMVFTFLAAQGKEIGKSLVETDLIPTVKELIEKAKSSGVELILPTDIVVAAEFKIDSPAKTVSSDAKIRTRRFYHCLPYCDLNYHQRKQLDFCFTWH